MRYQVPQFIEVEDKIFGPFTLKQFIYMAGGLGISFVLYEFLPLWLAAPAIVIILVFSAALAFWKINNKPFIYTVEAAFKYAVASKLYIWKKENRKPSQKSIAEQEQDVKKYASVMVPKIADSKLKDLAWSLDIKESMYSNKNQR